MLVIADSSALVALAASQTLEVFSALFDDVKVPQAVYDEVVIPEKSQSVTLEKFLDGKVVSVETGRIVLNAGGLGKGEIEAMALYKQLSADKLLIDDRRARTIAEHNQIECIGTLGILLLAKHEGILDTIRPHLELLRNSSIYYADELLNKTLEFAGE